MRGIFSISEDTSALFAEMPIDSLLIQRNELRKHVAEIGDIELQILDRSETLGDVKDIDCMLFGKILEASMRHFKDTVPDADEAEFATLDVNDFARSECSFDLQLLEMRNMVQDLYESAKLHYTSELRYPVFVKLFISFSSDTVQTEY